MLFGTRKWVADNRDALVRYLRAEICGWTENEANPAYGAKLGVEKYGAEFNLDLKRETRSNTLQMPYLHSNDTKANGLFWVSRDRINGPIYEAPAPAAWTSSRMLKSTSICRCCEMRTNAEYGVCHC